MLKHEAAPPRASERHEGEPHAAGELCIRLMERTMEGIVTHPVLNKFYDDLFVLLADTVHDELKRFASDHSS